jgi:hypothetical protein
MAQDFYPVIARAVAALGESGADARQLVYDHARTVLVRQLRNLNSGLSAGLDELQALEDAIQKLESEISGPELTRLGAVSRSGAYGYVGVQD